MIFSKCASMLIQPWLILLITTSTMEEGEIVMVLFWLFEQCWGMQGLNCHQCWETHSFTLCHCQLTETVSYRVEALCQACRHLFFFTMEVLVFLFVFFCCGQVFHLHKVYVFNIYYTYSIVREQWVCFKNFSVEDTDNEPTEQVTFGIKQSQLSNCVIF